MAAAANPGQLARRIFLWCMISSFCLAAAAGILVLLGIEFNETVAQVELTTVVVGLYSLAMLCCAAVFSRPERAVGFLGTAVALASLIWTVILIWSEGTWEWEPVQILLTGITLTVAFCFLSLLLASTTYRDAFIRAFLIAALVLISLATVLTVGQFWNSSWDNEGFLRFYGIVLILAVLTGVITPLASLLRRRTSAAPAARPEADPPSAASAIDPETAAALVAEAQRRGISVAQLVAPLLRAGNPREADDELD